MSDSGPRQPIVVWDDAAFRARVEAIGAKQGLSVRDVCRRAGLAADTLDKPAEKKGRSIVVTLAIAKALGVSILEIVSPEEAVGQTLLAVDRDSLGRLALTAHIAAHLYLSLDSHRKIPAPRDAERIVRVIIDLLDLPE